MSLLLLILIKLAGIYSVINSITATDNNVILAMIFHVVQIELELIYLQGIPKKMVILSGFEFLTLGGVFLGVKNNSKNSGTKKDIRLFSKILSKWTLFIKKMQKIFVFLRAHGHVKNGKLFKMS